MIAAPERGVVFLAQTKCASTSIEEVLAPIAEIVGRREPRIKHLNYRDFVETVQPMLERFGLGRESYEVISLIREPVDWLHSWWRYRTRTELADPDHPRHEHYTGEVSFEDFSRSYMEGGSSFAEVGRQAEFVVDLSGAIGVDRLFRYEELDVVIEYLSMRLGMRLPELEVLNTSPRRPLELSDSLRADLGQYLRAEYVLHEKATGTLLRDLGGPGTIPTSLLGGFDAAPEAASPLVLVTGTGGSTSAAVAGILARLGCAVPEPYRDDSSLVSEWLSEFHEEVASEAHVDLGRPRPDALLELDLHPQFEKWTDTAVRWLVPLVSERRPICLNHQGLNWTMPIWGRVAAVLGCRLKAVVVVRDPESFIELETRRYRDQVHYHAKVARAVEHWICTALTAEWATRGVDRVVVTRNQLSSRPLPTVEDLATEILAVSAGASIDETASWVASVVSTPVKAWSDLQAWTPLNDLASRMYWELRALATKSTGGTDSPVHPAELDSLFTAYQVFRTNWKYEPLRDRSLRLQRLIRGDTGPDVARLQALLVVAGFELEVDGVFGAETVAAVREFKTAQGLSANAIVGRSCWASLLGSASTPHPE